MDTPISDLAPTLQRLREAWQANKPDYTQRHADLQRLRDVLKRKLDAMATTIAADFGHRPRAESVVADGMTVLNDIDHLIRHLRRWMKPTRVGVGWRFLPARAQVRPVPVGVVGVIAPWNYPVNLSLIPLATAIAAGNHVYLKPSEHTPKTSQFLRELLAEVFPPDRVVVATGGADIGAAFAGLPFDHLVFTGSTAVGRKVMAAAAPNLTPLTLELGGKSPALIADDYPIERAAARIATGKWFNGGQTCIAPDYVLVEQPVHDQFVAALGKHITAFYGSDPQQSADFTRIVNAPHFHRLEKLLDSGTVAFGGVTDADTRYISPTVLTDVKADDPVMGEEIFGPILPVLTVGSVDEAIGFVNERSADGDKPLALYTFSESDQENDRVIGGASSGGVCVNGTLLHISNPNLPFGGVGESGMGAYHGKFGFDAFSHHRGVHTRSTKMDPSMLYPPYTAKKQKLVRKGMTMPDPRDLMARLRGALRRG